MKADVKSVLVCINLRFFFYINELFYGKTMIKYLVVGLGNIGEEYEKTKNEVMEVLRGHFRPEFLNRI